MPGENQHDEESDEVVDRNEDKNVDDNHDDDVDGNDEDYVDGRRESLRLVCYRERRGKEKILMMDRGEFFGQEKGTKCRFIGDKSEFRSRTKTVVEINERGNWQTSRQIR